MSKRESNILKGIGIILLYLHHLFYSDDRLLYPIIWGCAGESAVVAAARVGKICVAVFVFVSTYGLTKQYREKQVFEKNLVCRDALGRYTKLLLHFWCVFGIFLVLSAVLGRDLLKIQYGTTDPVLIIKYFFADVFGVSSLLKLPTFNATWWYLALALVLFLLVPALNQLYEWMGPLIVLICLIAGSVLTADRNVTEELLRCLPGVGAAVVLARTDILERWKRWNKERMVRTVLSVLGLLVCLAVCIYGRVYDVLHVKRIDSVLAVLLACLVTVVFSYPWTELPGKPLEILGQHSLNLFLMHTFIKAYLFRDFTYSFGWWWLILLVLLADTLLISVVLEYLKKRLGFYRLLERILKRMDAFYTRIGI